ncbi:hypothetical protein FOZ76_02885 [Verticiella sediminum]|uniref:Uncharacterized protein n=1 Tax=Verticiella sediminum TaxID=1247510 RepID=A0A556AZE9_9BURK|nr:hypothetical protein FOZ76_02885 [Verticiella sediminum]
MSHSSLARGRAACGLARRELQFGEWLREDLRADIVEPPTADPDLAILLTKARMRSVAVVAPPPAQAWFDPVPAEDLLRAYADTVALWQHPADCIAGLLAQPPAG